MRETALYPAVKRFLEARGFAVKGEIEGCDAVGIRPGDPPYVAVAELKLGLSLDLILQGVDRLPGCDEVWLAVLATRRGRDRDRRAHHLCRLLGVGLLAVNPARARVEVLVEPLSFQLRPKPKRRRKLLAEHAKRHGDPSPGGAVRSPVMTAYRQQALSCAAALCAGPLRPRDVAASVRNAPRILLRDVYGWFERIGRGVYRLGPGGRAALDQWGTGADAEHGR